MSLSFDEELEQFYKAATETLESSGTSYDPAELRSLLTKQLQRAHGMPETPTEPEAPEVIEEIKPLELKAHKQKAFFYHRPEDLEFTEFYIRGRLNGILSEGAMMFTGHSGLGKTMGVVDVADRLGVPLNIINCAAITTSEKWLGHKEVDPEKGTYYVLSEFLRIIEARGSEYTYPDGSKGYDPGVLLLDEVTRLHASLLNPLYSLLDGQSSIFVPELHTYVQANPMVPVIATANIGGRYSGTYQFDAALRERFAWTIELPFPPEEPEIEILTSRTGVTKEQAKKLVTIAQKTRIKYESGDLSQAISTRTLIHAALLIKAGATTARAFELTALPHYSKEGATTSERHVVSTIIAGKEK